MMSLVSSVSMATVTREEVARHCTSSDARIIVRGGVRTVPDNERRDATEDFFGCHRAEALGK